MIGIRWERFLRANFVNAVSSHSQGKWTRFEGCTSKSPKGARLVAQGCMNLRAKRMAAGYVTERLALDADENLILQTGSAANACAVSPT